jgi:hypothetical protein
MRVEGSARSECLSSTAQHLVSAQLRNLFRCTLRSTERRTVLAVALDRIDSAVRGPSFSISRSQELPRSPPRKMENERARKDHLYHQM